jgi:exopolysaccharide biosynthesis polyprenyl glycosylphosphotransferase
VRPHHLAPWWIVVLDAVLINVSIVLAYWLRYELQWFRDISYYHPLSAYLPFGPVFAFLMLLDFRVARVYRDWRGRTWLDHVYRIINAAAKSVVVVLAATFVVQPLQYSRLLLIEAGVVSMALLALSRLTYTLVLGHLHARGIGAIRVIVVGAGEIGRTVMRTIVARPQLGYQIVGFVDDHPEKGSTDIGRFRALGSVDNLPQVMETMEADEVIITLPWTVHRRIMDIVGECGRRQIGARIVPDLFQMSLTQVDVDDLGGVPLLSVREIGFSPAALVVKRAMDVVAATLGLTLGAPILALIGLGIRLDSPGPVIFRQTRVGKDGVMFEMYKFRSMRAGSEEELEALRDFNEVDGPIFKMRDDPRVTRVGRFLRRHSLDELPQLWNILRGEMSLVGPRPPIPDEVADYRQWHAKRLEVRPGLTGLWQVSGRSLLSFDEQVLLDVHYVENWSIWLDLKILLRTVPQVLLANGAY